MKVKVTILRKAGERIYHRGPLQDVRGELDLQHAPVPGEKRTIPVLRILGDDRKNQLFEPRLIYACAGKMKFSGLEHCDQEIDMHPPLPFPTILRMHPWFGRPEDALLPGRPEEY